MSTCVRRHPDFRSSGYIGAALVLVLVLFAVAVPILGHGFNHYTRHLFLSQDLWIAPFIIAACLVQPAPAHSSIVSRIKEQRAVGLVSMLLILTCWLGYRIVFSGFDGSPDERMVAFDAAIFRSGALVSPIPPEWRAFAAALNQAFILPIGDAEAWVSTYLPVNAAAHAAVGLIADEGLTSPLFVAAGAFALWRISLRLWPDSPGTRAAVLALYAGSSQILIMGMSKFAMSAHLALNLCWLALFLRGTRASHGLALFIGFLATGLHQPLFHPLFVVPFLALLARNRRWRLLGIYLLAYACTLLFWLAWPAMMSGYATGTAAAPAAAAEVSHAGRLLAILKLPDLTSLWLMAANLTRFIAWQHPLLLVLAIFAVCTSWRAQPVVAALAVSFTLPILFCWLILPWQGPGWGYRYLHPVLGNAILLGGWGWHALEQRGQDLRRTLVGTTAGALLLLIPVHAWFAHKLTQPYASVEARIRQIDSDVLILDAQIAGWFTYNHPDLTRHPVRLSGAILHPEQMPQICSGRSVTFIDPPEGRGPSERQQALKAAGLKAGCDVQLVRIAIEDHLLIKRPLVSVSKS